MADVRCPLDFFKHLNSRNRQQLRFKLRLMEKIKSKTDLSAEDPLKMASLLKEIDQMLASHYPPIKLPFLKEIEHHVMSASNCSHLSLKELTLFAVGRLKGTVPLLIACQQGELDSVKYIVESWGSDVNLNDSLTSSQFQIDFKSTTPLFIAAYNGHDQIVRYLLEKGADVSVKSTLSKSDSEDDVLTPLYSSAVCEPNPDKLSLIELRVKRNAIVRSLLEFGADPYTDCLSSRYNPSWMCRMCGVDATTALVNQGLDLKWRDSQFGETILHYWVRGPRDFTEKDSLVIVKLLIEKGAEPNAKNYHGSTPLLSAAFHLNLVVLDYLLKRAEFGIREKVNAMELAGSTILFLGQDASLFFNRAFSYLRRALLLRNQMETEEEKTDSSPKIWKWNIGGTEEWTTLAEFEDTSSNILLSTKSVHTSSDCASYPVLAGKHSMSCWSCTQPS